MFENMSADDYGYMKFGAGFVVTILVGVIVWFLNSLRPVLDDQLCVVGEVLAGHWVLVRDISEIEDAIKLAEEIQVAERALPQHYRLTVYRIADLGESPPKAELAQGVWPLVKVFSACNPGRGDQVNPFLVGARFAEKRYKKLFASKLEFSIGEAEEKAGSGTSPILSALARAPHIPHFGDEIPNRHLVIKSDLLQHTRRYTHYTSNFKGLDQALSSSGVGIPDFRGVEVEVQFVRRTGAAHRQTTAHCDFWREYFARAGVPEALSQPDACGLDPGDSVVAYQESAGQALQPPTLD